MTPDGARKFCMSAGVVWRQSTLDEVRIAYVRRLREQAAGRSSADGDLDLVAERARHAKAQADKIELELAETRGELVRVESVLTTWAGHVGTVKQALLGLPAKAAGMVAPDRAAEAEATLRAMIKETLMELSTNGMPRKRGRSTRRGGEDVAPTSGSDD